MISNGPKTRLQRTRNGDFLDIHEWVFRPSSLRLIVEDLFCLGLISLREDSFADTRGFEFFVTMRRSGRGPGLDRLSLLLRNASER